MTQKIFIGKISKGLEQFYLPFNIDNDAFPTLYNAYSWRGRIKRKRGTTILGRLQVQAKSVADATPPSVYQIGQFGTLSGSGAGSFSFLSTSISAITQAASAVITVGNNLFDLGDVVTFSGVVGMTQINGLEGTVIARDISSKTITVNINSSSFTAYASGGAASLNSNGVVPGSVSLSDGTNTYTEPAMPDGTLVGSPGGSGTINYATGVFTISGGTANGVIVGSASAATYAYFPGNPVMGLRDLVLSGPSQYPNLLAFDTNYSYQISQVANESPEFYNVNYYKTTDLPFAWSGANYQQFWTTNYQGALWATNNTPGLNFLSLKNVMSVSVTQVSATQVTITIASGSTLIDGDLIWINEVTGTIGSSTGGYTGPNSNINGQTGYIVSTSTTGSTTTLTVNFDGTGGSSLANFASMATGAGGILQILTNTLSQNGKDGIKWYDGDPTGGTGIPSGSGLGWINFSPPLTSTTVTIDDLPSSKYYLVGALSIVAFKDRLIFFSPWVQTSSGGAVQLSDTAIWSWNGTPYYSSLTPSGQTSDPRAYFVDQTGFAGWLSSGINQNIISVNNNEDVLLVGFTGKQTRFVYTSNDLYPFLFYIINSELGTSSTFSTITLDRGALSFGQDGIILTSQVSSQRIDLQIPTQVFQLAATTSNNATLRLSGARDYYHEWVHFTFFDDSNPTLNANPQVAFPNLTLQYNYREESWGFQYENFTAHGYFRKQEGYTWSSNPWNASLTPWSGINESWNSGVLTSLFPSVVAGNPQGFVVIKNDGTGEAPTGAIQALAAPGSGSGTQITSTNHCVNNVGGPLGDGGDYLYFSGCLGNTYLNFQIGRVITVLDADNFVVDVPYQSGTYEGLGVYSRLSQPLVQTKQFPVYWNEGRKVRLGAQKYLLDYTDEGQVTLNIYLSQDPDDAWNAGGIVPSVQVQNNSLIYSQILFTSPEYQSVFLPNLTLSIIGNGVTTSFTFNLTFPVIPSSVQFNIGNGIATFTDNGSGGFTATGTGTSTGSSINYTDGIVVLAFTVAPTRLTANVTYTYQGINVQNPNPTSGNQYQIWHRINTSLIGDTFQLGLTLDDAQMRSLTYAISEIALHAISIDVGRGPMVS